MFVKKISTSALRAALTPARLQELGLRPAQLTNEELKEILTPERQQELGLRFPQEGDDPYAHLPLIEFFCEPRFFGVVPPPVPGFKKIAKWFSKIPAELKLEDDDVPRDQFGAPVMTAKKCLPLLDGMSMGYVLSTMADFTIRTGPAGTDLLEIINPPIEAVASTHSPIQLGGKTSPTGVRPAVKFHNPWVIKTRPGWSTLFVPVLNHLDERFTCLAAAVDTDTYPKQVNFPAVFHADNFDAVIPAGTPLVVAIPYRRSTVERNPAIRVMTEEERNFIGIMERNQASRSHYYTGELRRSGKSMTDEPTIAEQAAAAGCPFHQSIIQTKQGSQDAQETD